MKSNYRHLISKKKDKSYHSRDRTGVHWRHGSIDETRDRSSIEDERIQEINEEEEKNSSGSHEGEKEQNQTKRKNLLCKTLL